MRQRDTWSVVLAFELNFYYLLGVLHRSNTVQVISGWVALMAKVTSTYSWSMFLTVNCGSLVSNYQLSHIKVCGLKCNLRGGRPMHPPPPPPPHRVFQSKVKMNPYE